MVIFTPVKDIHRSQCSSATYTTMHVVDAATAIARGLYEEVTYVAVHAGTWHGNENLTTLQTFSESIRAP